MVAAKGLESSLYQMKPLDAASYVIAVAGVIAVALAASGLPAGRAGSIDPSSALRAEL
jgi:ABC-type antimicrobial peptide transport system permease subunit